MNFATSTAPSSGRLQKFQLGSSSGPRTGLPLSATTFDYRNNNMTNSKIFQSVPDKYGQSANFPLKISGSSPRVPEIQMINKFYGLIPKKFVINERLRPQPPILIRQRSSTRPKTTKQSGLSQRTRETDEAHRLRRHSSVDDARTNDLNLEATSIRTPILTRRISFERNLGKPTLRKAERRAESGDTSAGLSALLNQRVIRIDLNHMRWEEETVLDEHEASLQLNEDEIPAPKSGILRKTISFDESALEKTEGLDSGIDKGVSLCKRHLLQVKERPVTAWPSVSIKQQQPTENSSVVPWTSGKTTAERRSKLQKAFSIHPSFADAAFNSTDSWGGESESGSYPESMTRTGRRSFHVEPPPEVDTLMSKGTSESAKPAAQRQMSVETAPVTTSVTKKPSLPETPRIPPPKVIIPEPKVPSRISALEPSERRKLLKKAVSLPVETKEAKTTSKKPNVPNSGKGLSRQNSAAVTKAEVIKVSSSSGKEKGERNRVAVVKKTLEELKRLRPKTAPSNNTNHNSAKGKTPESTEEDYKRRRQPMKVRSDVSGVSQSESRFEPGESKKQVTIMENKSQKTHLKKGSSKTESQKPTVAVPEAEVEPAPRPISPLPPNPMPRRSFSLDEGSLLTFSSEAAQQADSIENSIQNSKKREECLKIYERMKQGGCAVRLQTIFRGLMTPSEYRMFIAAAEKAAAASLAEAEAAAVAATETAQNPEGVKPDTKVQTENDVAGNESATNPSSAPPVLAP